MGGEELSIENLKVLRIRPKLKQKYIKLLKFISTSNEIYCYILSIAIPENPIY